VITTIKIQKLAKDVVFIFIGRAYKAGFLCKFAKSQLHRRDNGCGCNIAGTGFALLAL
jgi:hypothetical protein